MNKLILIVLGFFLADCTPEKEISKKPNVIIIFTDDQGYQDVGVFGSPDIETPHLDKMASEGIMLTDFYAAQAVCSASRAGLLTGCYPNRIGIHQAMMPNSKKGLNESETTIAEMLKSNGYATAIYGKWHLGDAPEFHPMKHGFDEFFGILYSNDMWPYHPQQGAIFNFDDLPLYENENVLRVLEDQSSLTTEITEKSVDFIKRNKDNPFFLYVAHPQPHVPLFVSDKFKGKSERGLYGDVIMEIDWSVGEILNALKETGLDENTMVIYTSDNGPWLAYGEHSGSALPLREGKGTAWEGGQREPFIIRYPGTLPAGVVLSEPLMAIDLLPTIASITGSALPDLPIDGLNIWPVLTGEVKSGPQEAYYFYYRVNELHGIRYNKWKMYFPHTYRSMNGREGGKNGLPEDYEMLSVTEIELYNLEEDKEERYNVANQNPEIVSHINSLADAMRIELGDKLYGMEGINSREAGSISESE